MDASRNAWGVWGKKPATPAPALQSGDRECCVCYDAPEQIRFAPCKHGACRPCVEGLRKFNVFKADAGVKCPFCRQYVERYEPIGDGQTSASTADFGLNEANRAARAAAVARLPPVEGRRQAAPQDVQAPAARNFNLTAGVKKDVMKCTPREIFEQAAEKMHPQLNQAFAEAGTPAVSGLSAGTVGGTPDTVIAAMSNNGQARLHKVIRILSDNGHVKELTTGQLAFYGNYTLQDMLDATHRLRLAAAKLRAQGNTRKETIDALLDLEDGTDALGRLASGIMEALPDATTHQQGSFVLIKLLDVAEPIDVLPMAAKLFPMGPKMTKIGVPDAWKCINMMCKLVQRMSELAMQPGHMANAAAGLLESLCGAYLKDETILMQQATHYHCGQMLVEAAYSSLPRQRSSQMLDWMARHAGQLVMSRSGLNTLMTLLALYSTNGLCQEQIVTTICTLALALENDYTKAMVREYGPPHPGHGSDLVSKLLERLSMEGEVNWITTIVMELSQGAGAYQHLSRALDVLVEGLSLPQVQDSIVRDCLQALSQACDHSKCEYIRKSVSDRRATMFPRAEDHHVSQHSQSNGHHPSGAGPAQPTFQFGSLDPDIQKFSGAFASAPRNLPADAAPAPPPPPPITSTAPRPHAPPPGVPAPTPGQPGQGLPNGAVLGVPQQPVPVRPVLQKLHVKPRMQVYQPAGLKKEPQRQTEAQEPQKGVPSPLAALFPHLMIGGAQPQAQKPQPPDQTEQQPHTPSPDPPPPAAGLAGSPHSSAAPSPLALLGLHPNPAKAGPAPAKANSVAPASAANPAVAQAPPSGTRNPRGVPQAAAGVRNAYTSGNNQQSGNGVAPHPPCQNGVQWPPRQPNRTNGNKPPAHVKATGRAIVAPHPPAPAATDWSCRACTYNHSGAEAEFLLCAICGNKKEEI